MNIPLICICSLLVFGFLPDAGVAPLDVRALRPQPAPELAERCTTDEYSRTQRYFRQRTRFVLASGIQAADPISALKCLSVKNLAHLIPHPLSVGLPCSHPPTLTRIHALQCLEAAGQRNA